MTMNSSFVFPSCSFQLRTQLQPQPQLPKHRGALAFPYSTSAFLYKTALTSASPSVSATRSSTKAGLSIRLAQRSAKALLSTVSDPSKIAKSSSASSSSLTSSSSYSFPKLMPGSLPLQIGIGCASACYWRGMWYVLDDQLYPENKAKSALVSLGAGSVGLAASQAYLFDTKNGCQKFEWPKTATMCRGTAAKKWLALYGLTTSCILIWRGAWVGCDVVYEKITNESALDPKHLTISGLASHGIALVGLIAMGRLSSTLGPPYHGTLVMKDEDKLNTKHLKRKSSSTKNMARMAGRSRMSMFWQLIGEGYGKVVKKWFPDKIYSIRKI